MASWEQSDGTRWALTPFWGPVHPSFKTPISHGPVTHGAIVALKVEESNGKFHLEPAWISRDMDQAEPPVIANGVIFAYGNGENTRQAYKDRGLADFSPLRIKASSHAVLYALDSLTGKELYSSGDQIKSWNHFSGLSVANGRVYIATYDSVLYCFGMEGAAK
jgi:outer membrane protein assembly factor BamB